MAWQTQLFCFSAMIRLGLRPIVIVHKSFEGLRPEFGILQGLGLRVVEAPSFRAHPKVGEYSPRNEIGSLLTIASISDLRADYILFCEADMLFVSPLKYTNAIAGEYYGYLRYEEDRVQKVARKYGFGDAIGWLNRTCQFGVPYFLPIRYVGQIALRWMEVLDSFEDLKWIDIMYAFALALSVEGLHAETTCVMDDSSVPEAPLCGHVIHYCYGGPLWSKRSFTDKSPFDIPDYALPAGECGTILAEMMNQIRGAREFFARTKQAALTACAAEDP